MLIKLKRIAKKILANRVVSAVTNRVNLVVLGVASSNRIFSLLYHFLFFYIFAREQHANVRGRYNYFRNLRSSTLTKVPLRRNIHRLEKGLIMKPRRPVFASDYIEETIKLYCQVAARYQANPDSVDEEEVFWATDVLRQYFDAVKATGHLKELKGIYEEAAVKTDTKADRSPFLRQERGGKPPVSYDDMLKLAHRRRSVRWFLQKPVPRELIDKALMVARQSPSSCNRLPFEYRIYDDPDLVQKVAGLPFGAAGYSHNVPVIVVLTGKLNNYFSPRDRHVIYVDAALSAMAFSFALETLGLASSMINWPDFEPLEIKMQRTLKLDTDERPVMLIAVGYADPKGGIPYSQKKSLKVLRSYNSIGSHSRI